MVTTIKGVTVDLSRVESDGVVWSGKVTFAYMTATATATWVGFDGSDMGELVDTEGASEALCTFIETTAGDFESAIADVLGDPSNEDTQRARWFAMAVEAEIDALIVRRVA